MPFIPLLVVFAAGIGTGALGTAILRKKRHAKAKSNPDQQRVKRILAASCQALKNKLTRRPKPDDSQLNGTLPLEVPAQHRAS